MTVGVHVPLRFLRAALKRGVALLKERLPAQASNKLSLEPALARLPRPQSHAHARLPTPRRYITTTTPKPNSTLRTPVRRTLARHTPTTPFASALRPKLVGGAIPRSAGGYSLGGSARYFSHTPTAPAQVIQQVSAAMRAFLYNGAHKRPAASTNGKIGVRALLASTAMENAPGTYVDFYLSPTFTRLSALQKSDNSLQAAGFVEDLGADFRNMVATVNAVYADLQRLAALGDLPVTLAGNSGDIVRVHFRGCDKEVVERICGDFGVTRGVVHEDERFAFAPVEAWPVAESWREMMSNGTLDGDSVRSEDGFDDDIRLVSGSESGGGGSEFFYELERGVVVGTPDPAAFGDGGSSSGYDEYEAGILRFLGEHEVYRSVGF